MDNNTIVEKAVKGYSAYYKSFKNYEGTQLWHLCIKATENKDSFSKIKSQNDKFGRPAAETFANIYADELIKIAGKPTIDDRDKQFIGTWFGMVFQFVLNYDEKQTKEGVAVDKDSKAKELGLKTASVFRKNA